MRRRLAFALLLLVPLAGRAQDPILRTDGPAWICRLPVPDAHAPSAALPVAPPALRFGGGEPTADIVVEYSGFTPEAQAAFEAAVQVWEQHIVSPVPIRIEANWTSLGTNVLGSAGPFLIANFGGGAIPNTWYPYALADALAGRDLQPGDPDIAANFSSSFSRWHFDVGTPPPANTVDLFTVVLHELGHGLGFIGSADVSLTSGAGEFGLSSGTNTFNFLYDRFTEDCQGTALLNSAVYPDPSLALGDVLQEAAYFGGAAVERTEGLSAKLFTPRPWDPGSSFSHFDEETYPPASIGGLMTPVIGQGELIASPDALLCAALQDLGWALAPACAALIPATPPEVEPRDCSDLPPPPEPIPDVYTLIPTCFNAFCDNPPGRSQFDLTVAEDQAVDVFVYDTRGRLIRRIPLGVVEQGITRQFEVDLEHAAAGLYLVHVVGEEFAATRQVVRAR